MLLLDTNSILNSSEISFVVSTPSLSAMLKPKQFLPLESTVVKSISSLEPVFVETLNVDASISS